MFHGPAAFLDILIFRTLDIKSQRGIPELEDDDDRLEVKNRWC